MKPNPLVTETNIHVAFFLPNLGCGGAERIILKIAKMCSDHGLVVDLLLANKSGEYLDDVPAGINIIDLQSTRPFKAIPALTKYLNQKRPKVLMSTITNANLAALISLRLSTHKCRCIIREASTLSADLSHSSTLNRLLVPRLIPLLYRKAQAIIAPSAAAADDFSRVTGINRDSISIIYNPVVSEEIARLSKLPVTHPWLQEKSPPVIIGMGRLTAAKDFFTLIQAFSIFRKNINSKLIILGEGEERQALETFIKELSLEKDVDLYGFTKNPFAFLARSQLFVLSSKWEGLPGALIEALACGVKIVSTDCPSGPREILDNGKYGYLVPVGDASTMADAMKKVITGGYKLQDPVSQIRLFHENTCSKQYLKLLM